MVRPNFQVLGYPILDYDLNRVIANERGVGDPKFMSMAGRMVFGAELQMTLDLATIKITFPIDAAGIYLAYR